MVQISVCWGGQLQGTEADVVKGFVVNAVSLIGVLNELVNRQGSIVRFNNGVGHFGRRHNAECVHDSAQKSIVLQQALKKFKWYTNRNE